MITRKKIGFKHLLLVISLSLAAIFLSYVIALAQSTEDEAVEFSFGTVSHGPTLSGKLPQDYWANTMQSGQIQVIDGVVLRAVSSPTDHLKELDEKDRLTLGLPPKELIEEIVGDTQADAAKRMEQRINLVKWVIEKEFSDLPADRKEILRVEVLRLVRQALTMHESVRKEKLTEDRIESIQRSYAELMADLLIAQRKAYRELPEIQLKKLGRKLDYSKPFPSRDELTRWLIKFVNGSYLSAKQDSRTEEVLERSVQDRITRHRLPPELIKPLPLSRVVGETIKIFEYQEEAPEYVAVEGRIYIAEHTLVDEDWMMLWPLNEIVHTNIIAGYWILKRQKTIVEQYRVSPLPHGVAETAERATQRKIGELVSRQRFTTSTWEFYKWMWANGNAGEYTQDDKLRLIEKIAAIADWDAANKMMFSFTGKNGRYCRNRATSYSLGLYGLDFVCHQTANAFMKHRRGYQPVFHWYSYLLYGLHGNYWISGSGISTCATIITDSAMQGCIPGNWCQGNHTPYILENAWSLLFELAPGHGWGLANVWHQGLQSWINSEARYSSNQVPFQGEGDDIVTLVEDLPLN